MKNKKNHEDLIIRYISDKNDLTDSELDMLENSEDAQNLKSDLNNISKIAADFAPEPLNEIVIPTKQPYLFTFVRPVLACSLALLLLIFAYKIYIPAGNENFNDIEIVYQGMATDELFMNEIDTLIEEVAYSDYYPETSTIESKYDFSDEFIEVIVPI